eukprot:TRINITY_DN28717_c0_g1_i1.p1 TRINITY_DN28717_c0_g1~~TRINITY_DN28717_c0_g1_i1.p1  ORF type:complete len:221 (-),score=17.67 TRINITY_DN28717_c0_g1_i1:75-737(-)
MALERLGQCPVRSALAAYRRCVTTMMAVRIPLLVSLACQLCSAAAPEPVKDVDVKAYLGHWKQVYASATVKYATEIGANCVTADYTPSERPDVIRVKNTVYPLGHKVSVTGYAVANPAQAGEFQVALGPGVSPSQAGKFQSANYVIFGLGPVVDGKYDYALVTDPKQLTLYVLTRDPARFAEQYNDKVLDQLKGQGFTSLLNRPLKTNQEGCRDDSVVLV